MAISERPVPDEESEGTERGVEGTDGLAARESHDPYAVLRLRDYRRFLLSGLVSIIGTQVQGVAVGWELYERTNSATILGLVGLVQFLPVVLLALPAGHAADRFRRKHQLLAAHLVLGLTSLSLAIISGFSGPSSLMLGSLLLAGIGQAIYMPARWAILPDLVPNHLLSSAVTWNSSVWKVAASLGPALGGAIIAVSRGATLCYLFDVACIAVVVHLVAPIRVIERHRNFEPLSIDSILAGIRFVRGSKLILATLTLDLLAVLLGGATALLPIFARDILEVGPSGLGWLRAAPSIGACTMALVLAHRPPLRRAGPTLLWAVAGFGVATIVFGLSRDPRLSFVMLVLTGAFDNVSVVVRATLVQVLTPDSMRGRVSAVNALFIGSSNELGGFESGVTAQLFGPVASVVGGGVGTILVVVAVAFLWPQVRHLDALHKAGKPGDFDVEDA
jgi:MFS family permease